MIQCKLCQQTSLNELIHFGDQPVCHRFVAPDEEEEKYPLALGQCTACGLVQLMAPMPVELLTPKFDWIKYNEPAAHLESLAQHIACLPGITPRSRMLGVCAYDTPLLERMRTHKFEFLDRIDPSVDLGLTSPAAGVEVIQDRLNQITAKRISRQRGTFDIVIARRILEHANDGAELLQALHALVRAGGYVVIEVPDCEQGFQQLDPSVIWEEHVSYFTPQTLQGGLTLHGLRVRQFENVPYSLENSLVVIAQASDASPVFPEEKTLQDENQRAAAFTRGLIQLREELHRHFLDYRRRGGKIALLGAGHRSCTYINLMGLSELFEFVIDDDPQKQRWRMPGSLLPIRPSTALLEEGITLCLLGINPEIEPRVMHNHRKFLEQGGTFSSISPGSPHALRI